MPPEPRSRQDWGARMRGDWDARAARSPHWFVDARTDFDEPDTAAFVRRGEADLARAFAVTGYAPNGDEAALELGCGMARMTGAIADRVARVVAVDISEGMLGFAARMVGARPDVSLLRTDGVSLASLADASFDLVVCNAVFQHLPDTEVIASYAREMARVLRADGVALVSLQSWTLSPYRWLRAAAAWVVDYHGFRTLGVYGKTFLGVRLTERTARELFTDAGLRVDGYWSLEDHRSWVRASRPR